MKNQVGFPDRFLSPTTGKLELPSLPDLTYNKVWIGDINNRPSSVTATFGNLPTGGSLGQILQANGNNTAGWGITLSLASGQLSYMTTLGGTTSNQLLTANNSATQNISFTGSSSFPYPYNYTYNSGRATIIHNLYQGTVGSNRYTGLTDNGYTLTYDIGANLGLDRAFFLNCTTNGTNTYTGNVFQFWPDSAGGGSTFSPQFRFNVPLYITSTAGKGNPNSGSTPYYYISSSGTGSASSSGQGTMPYFSLIADYRIRAVEFDAWCSVKKKEILSDNEEEIENEALSLLKKVPFFKYSPKDKVMEGKAICYGVTAESLNEVLPDYVDMEGKGFVPNVYCKGQALSIGKDQFEIKLETPLQKELKGSQIRVIAQEDKEGEETHELLLSSYTEDKIIVTSKKNLTGTVFVYGTYENCPSVSKQKLFEIGLIVIKNSLKRIEALENSLRFKANS